MAIFSVYCIGMTLFSTALPETRLSLFLAFVIIVGYILYPSHKGSNRPNYMPWYDIALMVIGAGASSTSRSTRSTSSSWPRASSRTMWPSPSPARSC